MIVYPTIFSVSQASQSVPQPAVDPRPPATGPETHKAAANQPSPTSPAQCRTWSQDGTILHGWIPDHSPGLHIPRGMHLESRMVWTACSLTSTVRRWRRRKNPHGPGNSFSVQSRLIPQCPCVSMWWTRSRVPLMLPVRVLAAGGCALQWRDWAVPDFFHQQ